MEFAAKSTLRKLENQSQADRPKAKVGHRRDATRPLATNPALIDSPEERVRELHNIDEKLIRDVASMNPAAAAYVRRHPCLSPESMTKWRCGYLPNDGGGDKRGWSLRGSILYPVLSEHGHVLAWVGRDTQYEQKARDYQQLSPAKRSAKEPPAKHRFPKGFHRGLELFGHSASHVTTRAKGAYLICQVGKSLAN